VAGRRHQRLRLILGGGGIGLIADALEQLRLRRGELRERIDETADGIVTLTFVRQPEVGDDFAAHITLRFGRTCPAARH
jgi:hypothetical protein